MKRSTRDVHDAACLPGAWVAKTMNRNQWIQADLLKPYLLTEVLTQGRQDWQAWTKSYYVSVSLDGVVWTNITTLYTANFDRNTIVRNQLPENTVAQIIQLRPQAWKSGISLRWDVIGREIDGKPARYYERQ